MLKFFEDYENLIQTRLASGYYYLGEYVNAEQMVTAALKSATTAQNVDLIVRSLYLISAINRTKANSAAKTSKDQLMNRDSLTRT